MIRRVIDKIFLKYILSLGFMHPKHPYIKGDKNRLLIDDIKTTSLTNTIFNTRSGTIRLEKGVGFGHNCMVLTGTHNLELDINQRHKTIEKGNDIYIGEGTWIASGAIILGNVKIGKFSVIGAGSVVTKDVSDYSFVTGIPAEVKKVLKHKT